MVAKAIVDYLVQLKKQYRWNHLAFRDWKEEFQSQSDTIMPHELPPSASSSGWMMTDYEAEQYILKLKVERNKRYAKHL